MGTIADKLTYLAETKDLIKDAIVAKGVDVPDGTPFREYAELIDEVSGDGGAKPMIETIATDKIANNIDCKVECITIAAQRIPPKYYYNGYLFPELPLYVSNNYPYVHIMESSTKYSVVFSTKKYYYSDADGTLPNRVRSDSASCANYQILIDDAETAEEWAFRDNTFYYWEISESKRVLWANYDMPNGAIDATEIYFEGSDPVQAV